MGRWKVSVAFALLPLAAGCSSYTSDYRPPNDGRARVVWDDDTAVALLPSGSSACDAEVDRQVDAPSNVSFSGGGHVGAHFVVIAPVTHVHYEGHHHGGHVAAGAHGGSHGGGIVTSGGKTSSSSGKDMAPEALIGLMALAIIAMPGITIGLAAGRPEPEEEVALAIDRVNAFNDLARYPGTPCSTPPAAPAGAAP